MMQEYKGSNSVGDNEVWDSRRNPGVVRVSGSTWEDRNFV